MIPDRLRILVTEPEVRSGLTTRATTTPAQDAKSPNSWALLPLLNGETSDTPRYLVGPTLLTLTSRVVSAAIVRKPLSGVWIVDVTLDSIESRQWDQVAKTYFHRQLAVDLNGVIVEAPFIQPANASFSSFEGQMQLSAVTKSDASDLAAALSSGPLAVPLSVSPWRGAQQVKGPLDSTTSGMKLLSIQSRALRVIRVARSLHLE